MAAALSTLRGALAGLSPSEKRLLMLLGVVMAVLAFAGLYYWSSIELARIESERVETYNALRDIRAARPRIAARNARRDALLARYHTKAPPLTSFVEEQAHQAHVQVAEAQDRPQTPSGRRFMERSLSIRLRHVSLQALAEFMDRIDAAEFPVAIRSVRIHRRFGEPNAYDVDDMVITTWDQVAERPVDRRNGNSNSGSTSASREAPR